MLFLISCLENEKKNEHKELYTIVPTDSSNFTISLDGLETTKTSNFDLDGKWCLVENSYLIFEDRKVYSTLNNNSGKATNTIQINYEDDYQTFAMYNKCIDEGGRYDKNGNFLVIGSGKEKKICYEIISFQPTKLVLYDNEKGKELEFAKLENKEK